MVSVSMHVAPHTIDCPNFHDTTVIQSGRLPSSRARPHGSRMAGIEIDATSRVCRKDRRENIYVSSLQWP